MKLHEYQAKQLFSDCGIAVPAGQVATSADEAIKVAQLLGGDRFVVKAQVHTGGRGKGGGVRLVTGAAEAGEFAGQLIGSRLVTHQTDAEGLPIGSVLVEQTSDIARELYLAVLVDRASERIVFMASEAGGMDIEKVAAETPDKILTTSVDPVAGLQSWQVRELGFALGLEGAQMRELGKVMRSLYALFIQQDASLVEINPLITTATGELVALDAKITIDDNALYKHPKIIEMQDATQDDEREHTAQQLGLNYITLDGNIGCLVNGAGLAMATMDLVKLHGGQPANFLDVGGGATADRVAEAFKIILSDENVNVLLVNIFGGIVRCDLIAEGILQAVEQEGISVPVIVRLEGTNVDEGKRLLAESDLAIIVAEDLTDAAQKAVAAG